MEGAQRKLNLEKTDDDNQKIRHREKVRSKGLRKMIFPRHQA